jgi:CRISPR/Cas system-associated exonuclease Cas4 (RecB family)
VDNLPYNPFPPNVEKSYAQETINLFNKELLKGGDSSVELHDFEEIYPYRNNWFNKLSSHTKEPNKIPFISHAVIHNNQNINLAPSNYKIAELGILVAINKKTTGLLIQYYPNHGNMFKVFEIKYKFNPETIEKIKETLRILKSDSSESINDLPKCIFSCYGCPYSDIC